MEKMTQRTFKILSQKKKKNENFSLVVKSSPYEWKESDFHKIVDSSTSLSEL